MANAAIVFWRHMPIAVILILLTTACICSARDIVLDNTYKVVEVATNERIRLVCGLRTNGQSLLWYKDGQYINSLLKPKLVQQKQWLRIRDFQAKDAGVYSCQNAEDRGRSMNVTVKHKRDKNHEVLEEYQSDVDVDRPMPEILSQHQLVLDNNNTIEENKTTDIIQHRNYKYDSTKDEDPDDRNERDHPNYGQVDSNIKKFPPRFKHPSKLYTNEIKPAGSYIRFKCAFEGNPTPNITWQKNGGPVVRSYFQPTYGKWSIALDELTKSDNGNYTCFVCNELGCINHTVLFSVEERLYAKPVLTQGAENQTKLIGETARFTCEFLCDLHPYLYWMFFNKDENIYGDIEYEDDSKAPMIHADSNKIIWSDKSTDKPEQLTIYNVTKEDEGWYVCVAINGLGNTTAKGYLTVLE